jgi:hypothetical protein
MMLKRVNDAFERVAASLLAGLAASAGGRPARAASPGRRRVGQPRTGSDWPSPKHVATDRLPNDVRDDRLSGNRLALLQNDLHKPHYLS